MTYSPGHIGGYVAAHQTPTAVPTSAATSSTITHVRRRSGVFGSMRAILPRGA